MTLCSRGASKYCHGEKTVSPLTTTALLVSDSVPKPAPRTTISSKQQTCFKSSHQFFAHYCNNSSQQQSDRRLQQFRSNHHQSQPISSLSPVAINHYDTYHPLNSSKYQREPKTQMNNHPMLIEPYSGNSHKLDNLVKQQAQTSEETNDSTSDDNDTEDSTDNKQEKPKVSCGRHYKLQFS